MAKPKKRETNQAQALEKRVKFLAHELEIEAALEKVRARAMSMRSSAMLAETSAVMFKQIKALGIDATRCGVGIFDDAHDAMEVWLTTTSAGEKVIRVLDYVNLHVHPVYENILAARKKKKPYAVTVLKGEEVKHYYNTLSAYQAGPEKRTLTKEETFQSFFFEQGAINITTGKPLSEEDRTIMIRFAKVFGLIYLRFMDLQKAEAQAGEARIEASLERVRSRSLAMRKSTELSEVAVILYEELRSLGVTNFFNCGFVEVDTKENIQHGWMTRPGGKRIAGFPLPLSGDPVLQKRLEAWQRQEPIYYESVGGAELKKHLEFVTPTIGSKKVDRTITNKFPDPTVFYSFNFSHGYLHIISDSLLNADEELLAMRFARVFEIAYRRFLDLKIAEAQAREAQIEAALERIRSKSMAMQRSEEMREVISAVMDQFHQLGFTVDLANFNFPSRSRDWTMWLARPGYAYPDLIRLPYIDHVLFNNPREAVKKGLDSLSDLLTRTEGNRAMEHFLANSIVGNDPPKVIARIKKAKGLARSMVFGKHIALTISNYEGIPYTADENAILRRFHGVFEQSYTRFLDLQKAEAQTREAQIELALERVRARTMAMHKSEELVETSAVLFHELRSLGVPAIRTGVAVFDKDKETMELWSSQLIEQKQNPILGVVPVGLHPFFDKLFQAWLRNDQEFTFALAGAEVKKYYQTASAILSYPLQKKYNPREVFNPFFFPEGSLTVVSHEPLNLEERNIMRRFANVFGLLYRRFLDLQKAEAQAREAQIEAALERVRSRSMAMHHTSELQEVINTVHQQFKVLHIAATGGAFIAINEENKEELTIWGAGGLTEYVERVRFPFFNRPIYTGILSGMKKGPGFFTEAFSREEKIEFFKHLFKHPPFSQASQDRKKELLSRPGGYTRSCYVSKYTTVFIINHHGEKFSEEDNRILNRFGSVFEQTYTRFLDLQKAEAQAREGQIQLAMERVRARTMAMQKSDELPEAATLLFQQVQSLGMPAWSAGYCIWDEDKKAITLWMSSEGVLQPPFKLPLTEDPSCIHFLEAHQRGESFYVEEIGGEEIRRHYQYMQSLPVVGDVLQSIIDAGFPLPTFQIFHCAYFSKGFLLFITYEPVPEAHDIFKRFGAVFEQTYTRFLDLQKAEAQAREAQVEASLERVRSSMMAMHQSEGLAEVMKIVADQLLHLGVPLDNVLFLQEQRGDDLAFWSGIPEKTYPLRVDVPYTDNPLMTGLKDAMKEGREFSTITLSIDDTRHWWQHIFDRSNIGPIITAERKQYILGGKGLTCSIAGRKNSMLVAVNYNAQKFSEEANTLLKRFANVFEQAYTRFLDIQTAEAQAREAQIEAALERVRSRSLAMHRSSEMQEVVAVVFQQLLQLGVNYEVVSIDTRVDHSNDLLIWIANEQNSYSNRVHLPYTDFGPGHDLIEAMDKKEQYYSKVYSFEEKNRWWMHVFEHSDFRHIPAARKDYILNAPVFAMSAAIVNNILFQLIDYSGKITTEQEAEVVKRFARVFEQCYVRFQDLEKSEAQARDAQIEAVLERVRSSALAMQKPGDMLKVCRVISDQLQLLEVKDLRNVQTLVINPEKFEYVNYQYFTVYDKNSVEVIDYRLHPVESGLAEKMLTSEEAYWSKKFEGEELENWRNHRKKTNQLPDPKLDAATAAYYYFFSIGAGALGVTAYSALSEDDLNTFRRFRNVFELAYKRYKDLEDAEARALLAVREASLDRVRAEIASMRHADDLQRITPLMWRELRTLGVPFFRCGVLIINEDKQQLNYYLSTPDGHPLAALHLDFNTTIEVVQQALHHWQQQKDYINHWNREQFVAFARSMMEQGQIQTMKSYQGGDQPPESLTLQFIPFAQGMLYVGSADALSPDQLKLVHALADAFSTAYARYEDFTKLEAAKATVEKALSELRTTQTQLVQSEKMASLGELTAGIAHEIQNPLNFVNNFSEVSKELLDEMEDELKKGNTEDALQIAKDIIHNLEKINFHGKRADGIVKSMLQHSRKSSGQKEPTDINALCDEYLRLSYHGLRAKDKSFNAKFETDFDPTVGQISVLPQDIGRVILNLINNAFYACTERSRSAVSEKLKAKGEKQDSTYEPTVIVSTKSLGNRIEITVRDNGTGIPDHIKDKIFQPFFTTKPTGQGTGLGLSLSYDIVKSHGGEITLDTNTGNGTAFTITLPLS